MKGLDPGRTIPLARNGTGTTILLTRAGSSYLLTLLMAALLAWPSGVPVVAREPARPAPIAPVPSEIDGSRPRLAVPPTKSHPCPADKSVDAESAEEQDVRDDSRVTPMGLPHRTVELPSLVPAALEARPRAPGRPSAPAPHSSPLRC